jgi:hypothetical protein
MRLSAERKLFVGLRVDAAMKRLIEEGNLKGRPVFKAGDPAHLELLRDGEDLYLGRVVESGFPVSDLQDLERNIRSIVNLTFPEQRRLNAPLKIFVVEEEAVLAASA